MHSRPRTFRSPVWFRFITHPTNKQPESLNIVALGPSGQQYHATHYVYDPAVPICDETWTCNKGFRTVNTDVVFILDDLIGEARKSARYAAEVRRAEVPIITSVIDREVKEHFDASKLSAYPIHGVLDFYGVVFLWHQAVKGGEAWENVIPLPQNGSVDQMRLARQKWGPEVIRNSGLRCASYLKNSVPMILAYAGYIGVRSINLWGADYDFPGHAIHEADKPNCEYWVGLTMLGLGITYQLPQNTTLLSTNQGREIYGYGARQPLIKP